MREEKGSYYEGGIRVPLIIKWQNKIVPNSSSEIRISNLDFYPTLQKIVNPNKKVKILDGIDISPVFMNNKLDNRDLYFHFPIYLQAYDEAKDQGRDSLFRTRPGSVIISGDWKLHKYFEDGELKLYKVKSDIGETNNIAKKQVEIANELLLKLNTWRVKTNAPIPTTKNPQYDASF